MTVVVVVTFSTFCSLFDSVVVVEVVEVAPDSFCSFCSFFFCLFNSFLEGPSRTTGSGVGLVSFFFSCVVFDVVGGAYGIPLLAT